MRIQMNPYQDDEDDLIRSQQRELYGVKTQASLMQPRGLRESETPTHSSYTILNTQGMTMTDDGISNTEKRNCFEKPLVVLNGDDNYELNEPSSYL